MGYGTDWWYVAKVLGARSAFFSYLMLGDGHMAQEVSTPELWQQVPKMIAARESD